MDYSYKTERITTAICLIYILKNAVGFPQRRSESVWTDRKVTVKHKGSCYSCRAHTSLRGKVVNFQRADDVGLRHSDFGVCASVS